MRTSSLRLKRDIEEPVDNAEMPLYEDIDTGGEDDSTVNNIDLFELDQYDI